MYRASTDVGRWRRSKTHIHVGSVQHMSAGATRKLEAVEQVIAELGPPEISFVENATPASRITGVRRWLPLMLPAALLTMAVMAMVWTIVAGLEDGWTYGHQGPATWWYGRFVAIDALLVWAAVFAIRRADRRILPGDAELGHARAASMPI